MKDTKKEIVINLKKSKSLISKLIDMVEKDAYCIDVMQQNLASIGLLRSVHLKMMEKHLSSCFLKGVQSKNQKKRKAMIDEVINVNKLFTK